MSERKHEVFVILSLAYHTQDDCFKLYPLLMDFIILVFLISKKYAIV